MLFVWPGIPSFLSCLDNTYPSFKAAQAPAVPRNCLWAQKVLTTESTAFGSSSDVLDWQCTVVRKGTGKPSCLQWNAGYHLICQLCDTGGEGNGSPLQCSCLKKPRDGGAWWAAVCGVARSRTRLKLLSSSSSRVTLGKLAEGTVSVSSFIN